MFEIHIAVPVVARVVLQAIFTDLASIGLGKCKFFYRVENIRPADGACHPAGTPPTGHDLAQPGAMATAKVASYEEVRKLLLAGMEVLAKHGVQGNFEIEGFVDPTFSYPAIDLAQDFPGYRRVADAPDFENHIVWKAPLGEIPSVDQIVRWFEISLGVTPHQIVDFGRDWDVTPETVVSRVATVYQPSVEAVDAFAERLRSVENTLRFRYGVAERVLLVGEPS